MIYNIPIESIKERYSADWNNWFPDYWTDNCVEYHTIYGEPLVDEIRDGEFLDVVNTNYFKAEQLKRICLLFEYKQVRDGDIFFFHDLWFPGIEMLAYMRDALGIKFKICGILHAGTYDPWDYISQKGMGSWGKDLETSWFRFIDRVYVATGFHRYLLYGSGRHIYWGKICITGLPIYPQSIKGHKEKENIVIFPHRLSIEKQPEMFDELAKEFKDSGWEFIKTKDIWKKDKSIYYDTLNKAKIVVSFALQETWGIAQQEATFADCIPVVPSRLSYLEMYDRVFQYNDFQGCVRFVRQVMGDYEKFRVRLQPNKERLIKKGKEAIECITKDLLS